MHTGEMKQGIIAGAWNDRILDIYVDETKLEYQKARYVKAIELFEQHYGAGEAEIFSAPGRSEVGGNHTDHQHGEVLAASINLDTIGVARKTDDNQIRIISDDYAEVVISLEDIARKEEENATTTALIKGVLAGFTDRGYRIGGFVAYATSDVLIGAGLSSSAAFETLIGTILSGLYNEMSVSATTIAIIGQYAENVYFGKPCGLMDQMACSVGNLVHIDFENPLEPIVEKLGFDMGAHGYSLCITDTKGSHADLTNDYAAVPKEMKMVAAYFGKSVLREVAFSDVLKEIPTLREKCGDRSVLRALHFYNENERVQKEVKALQKEDMQAFLEGVKESGDSSFKYLQNVYSDRYPDKQPLPTILALSGYYLKDNGVCRVHGGGFAGTILNIVKNDNLERFICSVSKHFGSKNVLPLRVRSCGAKVL